MPTAHFPLQSCCSAFVTSQCTVCRINKCSAAGQASAAPWLHNTPRDKHTGVHYCAEFHPRQRVCQWVQQASSDQLGWRFSHALLDTLLTQWMQLTGQVSMASCSLSSVSTPCCITRARPKSSSMANDFGHTLVHCRHRGQHAPRSDEHITTPQNKPVHAAVSAQLNTTACGCFAGVVS